MHDTRPLYKRAKFMAYIFTLLFLVSMAFLQMLGAKLPESFWTAAVMAVPIGLPMFQLSQGAVDHEAKKSASSADA